MNRKIFLFLALFFISFVSSQIPNVYNDCEIYGNCFEVIEFNNNTAFVNASGNWVTISLGTLNDANSTQFENNGGVLSIIDSWLQSFIIAIGGGNWLALNGSNSPTNSIDWGNQRLSNIKNLSVGTIASSHELTVEGNVNITDNTNVIAMYMENGYLVVEG